MTDTQDTVTQALPTPGAGERMDHVAITSIARSLTNPRKHFDPAKLQELADSIAASGVHQPILLRPLPVHRLEDTHREARALKQPAPEYELVAGERRWRACQLAGVKQVPAMIRPMTDAQALEAQVIENLQREDVTELEEAEGYRVLMDSQGISLEQVAQKIGKSKSYVHTRIKILELCQLGQEALREGKIDFSCALPIARIPDEQLQIKALEEALHEDYEGVRMSAREVQLMVRRSFMLQLDKAPFDIADADLCPKAGACSTCQHRTGANRDLFADVDSADVCTNPPCYRVKEQAHAQQIRLKAEQMGAEIIDGREAKALLPSAYSTSIEGYLRLDNKNDSPVQGKTLRSALAEVMATSCVQPTIIVSPHSNEMIAVLREDQAHELIAAAGHTEAQEKIAADKARRAEYDKEADELAAELAYERGWRQSLLQRVIEQLAEPSLVVQDAVARIAARSIVATLTTGQAQDLCKLLGMGKVAPVAAMKDRAAEHPFSTAGAVIAVRDSGYAHWLKDSEHDHNPRLLELAAACDIDVAAIKAQTQANLRAEKQSDPVKPEAPKGDIPQRPLRALAGVWREAKPKMQKKPAAHAGEAPKTSSAHASAQIAEALQAMEADDSGAAAAAQGNDGEPVAVAQAPISGADAQGNEAAPVAAKAAQGLPPSSKAKDEMDSPHDDAQQPADAQAAAGDDGQDSTDAKRGTAAVKAWSASELLGEMVRILPSANGKKQKPWIGYEGTVTVKTGPESVFVSIPRAPRCAPVIVGFHVSELEVVA